MAGLLSYKSLEMGRNAMATMMKDLGLDRLPVEERLRLMHEIWDSIAAEPGLRHLSVAQESELRRRLAEHETDPDDVASWDEVKSEALKRLQP